MERRSLYLCIFLLSLSQFFLGGGLATDELMRKDTQTSITLNFTETRKVESTGNAFGILSHACTCTSTFARIRIQYSAKKTLTHIFHIHTRAHIHAHTRTHTHTHTHTHAHTHTHTYYLNVLIRDIPHNQTCAGPKSC